jgi:hypothetical protein
MSIRQEWIDHVQAGRLHRVYPFRGEPVVRTVLVSPEINELIVGPWDDEEMGIRCARLLAILQRIVRGEILKVCLTPFEARQAQLGRLDPVEDSTFDIRSLESPALRVFCGFAEKDVVIALVCAPRSVPVSWLAWLPLGGRHSREWKRAIRQFKRDWGILFPGYERVSGDCLDVYLSNAVLERSSGGS